MTALRTDRVDRVAEADVVVVGSGVAGLVAALGASEHRVSLLTKKRLASGSSQLAQGGIAAAVGPDDSSGLHATDTLAVAGGLADPMIVEYLTSRGPAEVRRLAALGARFDRDGRSGFSLGREAAHSRARILHAFGDATGAEVVRTLVEAVRSAPGISIFEQTSALELVQERGRVVGILTTGEAGERVMHLARAVVLATGGSGRVYARTTNPQEATGDGLAMAARAGAMLADLEFYQFHPTALAVGADPMPLVTEALRGAGARLIDDRGRRFLAAIHPLAELAPRDVVAKAIFDCQLSGGEVFLDAVHLGADIANRFPTVVGLCRSHGVDPVSQPIPVSPAAHYQMGGVAVDANGRTTLAGLWACGEVACTGAHGANRLASNSLLEALVFGARVASDLTGRLPELPSSKALLSEVSTSPETESRDLAAEDEAIQQMRTTMWASVGIRRDKGGLQQALAECGKIRQALSPNSTAALNLVAVSELIVSAALQRNESRGAHFRSDYPTPASEWHRRLFYQAGKWRRGPDLSLKASSVSADSGVALR